jgi:DNA-binding response OmpR family regulator
LVHDYVTKPFGIDELLARIGKAQRHRLAQEGKSLCSMLAIFASISSGEWCPYAMRKSSFHHVNMKFCASWLPMPAKF